MSEKSLVDSIKHYQRDIERCPDNKERMLRCIKRLYVMPVKVEHLQLTGVGRSVNNLREVSGEVGDAASALVAKWKAMVAAEDLEHEEESTADEEEEVMKTEKEKIDCRVSPDPDRSVKDKENIRLNHRTDKFKSEKSDKLNQSTKHSDKNSKDHKSKHSSHDKETLSIPSSKNDSKNSSSSKDRRDKENNLEKHRETKNDSKSSSEKSKRTKDEKDKHHSKDKDKHSKDKNKEVSKEKEKSKHSSSSKDKSSKEKESKKDKISERSKDQDKNIKKEKRSKSPERESRKTEKRKHHSKERHDEKPVKKIKQEKISSDEEEDLSDNVSSSSDRLSNRHSDLDNLSEEEQSFGSGKSNSDSEDEHSGQETFTNVKIKQEPLSDSESEKSRKKKSSHRDRSNSQKCESPPPTKSRKSEEMKPPSSTKTDNLKTLIKENEKKVKKEKVESEKSKKSKVKIEVNKDGSIDSGSGASFADVLMGFEKSSPKKKKKKDEKRESSSRLSVGSSLSGSHDSVGRHSPSPSQCSTSSSHTSSPSKHERKSIAEIAKEGPEALLKKSIKLEPLNIDISSTLPEISTNYKPLPTILQSRHTPQMMSEEDMFSHMTSKNQRTKVYSGYKYGHTATIPSLYSFCIQILHDNIDGLEYTGGVPFDILKPLLIKLNAEQLLNLEHYNPYLVLDTDDLWKFHCKKTFPKAHPEDMETWRETYLRFMDERERKLKRLTANITESMAIKGPARQAKLAYVDTVAKPPRNIARKQAKYGTGSSSPTAGTSSSGPTISQIAAAQNQAKKKEIVSKAIVGGFTPAAQATEQVPAYNNPATAAKMLKKKKAPLMAKALQLIKSSNSRYKR